MMKEMIVNLLKWLFAASAIIFTIYSIRLFGEGVWAFAVFAVGMIVLLSVWIRRINPVGVWLARIGGVLSLVAFGLLMLAATVGGSFRLSQSNQEMAMLLVMLSVFGLSAFAWPERQGNDKAKRLDSGEDADG